MREVRQRDRPRTWRTFLRFGTNLHQKWSQDEHANMRADVVMRPVRARSSTSVWFSLKRRIFPTTFYAHHTTPTVIPGKTAFTRARHSSWDARWDYDDDGGGDDIIVSALETDTLCCYCACSIVFLSVCLSSYSTFPPKYTKYKNLSIIGSTYRTWIRENTAFETHAHKINIVTKHKRYKTYIYYYKNLTSKMMQS